MGRILIVEDEPAIAELITMNLRHDGHEVQVAADSQSAQGAIDRALPDLVILDWMLPGESGIQLAQRWRRDTRTRDLPIVMLTARSDERDIVQGLDEEIDIGGGEVMGLPGRHHVFDQRDGFVGGDVVERDAENGHRRGGAATGRNIEPGGLVCFGIRGGQLGDGRCIHDQSRLEKL